MTPVISCADVVEAAGSGAVATNHPQSGEPPSRVLPLTGAIPALVSAAGVSKLVPSALDWRAGVTPYWPRRGAYNRAHGDRSGSQPRLNAVGEGVEKWAQATLLEQTCRDRAQGFHFAEPLPPEAMAEFLADPISIGPGILARGTPGCHSDGAPRPRHPRR